MAFTTSSSGGVHSQPTAMARSSEAAAAATAASPVGGAGATAACVASAAVAAAASSSGSSSGAVDLAALAHTHVVSQYPIWLPPAQYGDPTREAGAHLSKADLLTGKQHRNRLRDTQLYLSSEMLEWTKHTLKRNIIAPDVFAAFANGELLCALLNTISPPSPPLPICFGAVVKSAEARSHVANFLRMASRLGVATHNLFKAKDLMKRANDRRVMRTLLYLSLALIKYGARPLPCLEPKIRALCAATGYALPEVLLDGGGAGASTAGAGVGVGAAGAAAAAAAATHGNALGRFGSGYVRPAAGSGTVTGDSAPSTPADRAETAAAERRRRELEASADFRPKLHFLGGGGNRRKKPLLPSAFGSGDGFGSGGGYISTAGDMFQPVRSASPFGSGHTGVAGPRTAFGDAHVHANPNATNVSPPRSGVDPAVAASAAASGGRYSDRFNSMSDPHTRVAPFDPSVRGSEADTGHSGASTPAASSSAGAGAANLGLSNIGILSHDCVGMPIPSFPHPGGERFEAALQNLDLSDLLLAAVDETDIDRPNMASLLFPAFASSAEGEGGEGGGGGGAPSASPSAPHAAGSTWQRDGAALHARVDPLKFAMWSSRHPFYSLLLSASLVLLCVVVLFGSAPHGRPFQVQLGAGGFHRAGDSYVEREAMWRASVQNSWAYAQVGVEDLNFDEGSVSALATGAGRARLGARTMASESTAAGGDDASSSSSSSIIAALISELSAHEQRALAPSPGSGGTGSPGSSSTYAESFVSALLDAAADGFDFDSHWRARHAAKAAQRRRDAAMHSASGDGGGNGAAARQLLQSSDSDADAPYPEGTAERSVLGASLSLLFILRDSPTLLTAPWLRRLRQFEISLLDQPTYKAHCLRAAGPSTALAESLGGSAAPSGDGAGIGAGGDPGAATMARLTGRYSHCELPDSPSNYYFARIDPGAQVAFMDGANFTSSAGAVSRSQNVTTINRLLQSWGRIGFFDRGFATEFGSDSSAPRSAHVLSTFSFGTPLPRVVDGGTATASWSTRRQLGWLEAAVLDAYIDQVEGKALGAAPLPGEEDASSTAPSAVTGGTVLLALDGPGVQMRILSRIIYGHDLPLIAGAVLVVLVYALSHFRSILLAAGLLAQVCGGFLVAGMVLSSMFGEKVLTLVHVLVLFVGLALGIRDAFVLYDCFTHSALLRLRVELPVDRAVRKAREAREAYEARQVDPSFRGWFRRLWWDETRAHEAFMWARNNLVPCATVTDYELAEHFEVGVAHSNPLAPGAASVGAGAHRALAMGVGHAGGGVGAAAGRGAVGLGNASSLPGGGGGGARRGARLANGAAGRGALRRSGSRARSKPKGLFSAFMFSLMGGSGGGGGRGRGGHGHSRSSTPTRLAPDSDDDTASSFFDSPNGQSQATGLGQNNSALSVVALSASASSHPHRRLGSQDFNPPVPLPWEAGGLAAVQRAAAAAAAMGAGPSSEGGPPSSSSVHGLAMGRGAAGSVSSPSGPMRMDDHEAALASDEVSPPFASAAAFGSTVGPRLGAGVGVGVGATSTASGSADLASPSATGAAGFGTGVGAVRTQGFMGGGPVIVASPLGFGSAAAVGAGTGGASNPALTDAERLRERDREREAQRERARTQRVLAAIASMDHAPGGGGLGGVGGIDEEDEGDDTANLEAMASRARSGAAGLRSAIRRKQADRLALRLSWSLRRAAPAMLTTNLTVVVALYSIALSPLVPLKSFGLWVGTLALVNSAMSLTIFPTLLVVQHVYTRHIQVLPEWAWTWMRGCTARVGAWVAGDEKYERALAMQAAAASANGPGERSLLATSPGQPQSAPGAVEMVPTHTHTHMHAHKSGSAAGAGASSPAHPALQTLAIGAGAASPPGLHRVTVSISVGGMARPSPSADEDEGQAQQRIGNISPVGAYSSLVGGVNFTKAAPWTPHSRVDRLGERDGSGAGAGEEAKDAADAPAAAAAASAAAAAPAPVVEGALVKKRLAPTVAAGLSRDPDRARANAALEKSRRNQMVLLVNAAVFRFRFVLLAGWAVILALCVAAAVRLTIPERILSVLPPGSNLELLREAYAQMPQCSPGSGSSALACTYDYARVERQVLPWAAGIPVGNSEESVAAVGAAAAASGSEAKLATLSAGRKRKGKGKRNGRKMQLQSAAAAATASSAASAALAHLLASPSSPAIAPPPAGLALPRAKVALPLHVLAEAEAEAAAARERLRRHPPVWMSREELHRERERAVPGRVSPTAAQSMLKSARRLKAQQQQQQQQGHVAQFLATSTTQTPAADFLSLSLGAPSPPPLLLLTQAGFDWVRVVFAQSVFSGVGGVVDSYELVLEPEDSEEDGGEDQQQQFDPAVPASSLCSAAASAADGARVRRMTVALRPSLSQNQLTPLAPCVTSANVSCAFVSASNSSLTLPLAPVTLSPDWFATATVRGGVTGVGVTTFASGAVVQDMRGLRPGTAYRATIRARAGSASGAGAGSGLVSGPSAVRRFRTLDATPPPPVLLAATVTASLSKSFDAAGNINPLYELRVRLRVNHPNATGSAQLPQPLSFRLHWEADVDASTQSSLPPLPPDGSAAWADVAFSNSSCAASPSLFACEVELGPVLTTQLRGGMAARVWLTTSNVHASSPASNVLRAGVPVARPYAPVLLGYTFLTPAQSSRASFLTPVLRVYFVALATNQDAPAAAEPSAVELVWSRNGADGQPSSSSTTSSAVPWSAVSVAPGDDPALPVGALLRPAGLSPTAKIVQADFGLDEDVAIAPNSVCTINVVAVASGVSKSNPSAALLAASPTAPVDPPSFASLRLAGGATATLTIGWNNPAPPSALHPSPVYASYTVHLSDPLTPEAAAAAQAAENPALTALPREHVVSVGPGQSLTASVQVEPGKQYYLALSASTSYARSERGAVECFRAVAAAGPGDAHALAPDGSLSRCATTDWNQLCVANFASSSARNCAGSASGGTRTALSMRRPIVDHMVTFELPPAVSASSSSSSPAPTRRTFAPSFTRRFVLSNPNGTRALQIDSIVATPLTSLGAFAGPRSTPAAGGRVACADQPALGYDPWAAGGGAVHPGCLAPCYGDGCVTGGGGASAAAAGASATASSSSLCGSLSLSLQRLIRTTGSSSSSLSLAQGPRVKVLSGSGVVGGAAPFTAASAALGELSTLAAGSGSVSGSSGSGSGLSVQSETQLVVEVSPLTSWSPGLYLCGLTLSAGVISPSGAVSPLRDGGEGGEGGAGFDPDIVLSLRILPLGDLPAPVREVQYGVVTAPSAASSSSSDASGATSASGGKNITFTVPYAPPVAGASICAFHLRYAREDSPSEAAQHLYLPARGAAEGGSVSALLALPAGTEGANLVFSIRALNARGAGLDFEAEWPTSECASTSVIPADPSLPGGASMYGLEGCSNRGSCATPARVRLAQSKPWGVVEGATLSPGAASLPVMSPLVLHDVASSPTTFSTSAGATSTSPRALMSGSYSCRCGAGWFGPTCSSSCPSILPVFTDPAGSGAVVPAPPSFDATCSGRGKCLAGNHTCLCQQGAGGLACEGQCPSGCNGRGDCVLSSASSSSSSSPSSSKVECRCAEGWGGPACEAQCPRAPGAPSSDPPCSGRGSCDADLSCRCLQGHRGVACHLPCPGGYSTSNGSSVVCSGRGRCMPEGAQRFETPVFCLCDDPLDSSADCSAPSIFGPGGGAATLPNKYYSSTLPPRPRLPAYAFPAVQVTWGVRGVSGGEGDGDAGVAAELAESGNTGSASATLSASSSRASGSPIYARSFDLTQAASQSFLAAACDVFFASGLVHEEHTPGCVVTAFLAWNAVATNPGATGTFPVEARRFTRALVSFLDSIPASDARAPWKQHVGFVFASSPFTSSESAPHVSLSSRDAPAGDATDGERARTGLRVQSVSERHRRQQLLQRRQPFARQFTPSNKAGWLASLLGRIGVDLGNSSSPAGADAAAGKADEATATKDAEEETPVLLSYHQLQYLRTHAAHGTAFRMRFHGEDEGDDDEGVVEGEEEQQGHQDPSASGPRFSAQSARSSRDGSVRAGRQRKDASVPIIYVRIASLSMSFLATFDAASTPASTQLRYARAWSDLVEEHVNPRAPGAVGQAFHSSAVWPRMSRALDFSEGVFHGFALSFAFIFAAVMVATGARFVLSLLVIISLLGVVAMVCALLVGGGMSLGAVEFLCTQVVLAALAVPPLIYLGSAYSSSPFGSRFGRARQALLEWGPALFSSAGCMALSGFLLLFATIPVLSNAGAVLCCMSLLLVIYVPTFYLPLLQCVGPMARDQRAARKEQRRARREREAKEKEEEETVAAEAAATSAANAAAFLEAARVAAATGNAQPSAGAAFGSSGSAGSPSEGGGAGGAIIHTHTHVLAPRGTFVSASSGSPSGRAGTGDLSPVAATAAAGSTPDFIQPALAVLDERDSGDRTGDEPVSSFVAAPANSKRITQTLDARQQMFGASGGVGLRNGGGFGSARPSPRPTPTPSPPPQEGAETAAASSLGVRIHAAPLGPSQQPQQQQATGGSRLVELQSPYSGSGSDERDSSLPASPSGHDWPGPAPSPSNSASASALAPNPKRGSGGNTGGGGVELAAPRTLAPLAPLAPLKGRPFAASASLTSGAAAGTGPAGRSNTRSLLPLNRERGRDRDQEGSPAESPQPGDEFVATPSFPADERRGGGGNTRPSSIDWDASSDSVDVGAGAGSSPAHRVSTPLSAAASADGSGRKRNRLKSSPSPQKPQPQPQPPQAKTKVKARELHFDDSDEDEEAEGRRGDDDSVPAVLRASAPLQPAAPVTVHMPSKAAAVAGSKPLPIRVPQSVAAAPFGRSSAAPLVGGGPTSPSQSLADSAENDWDREDDAPVPSRMSAPKVLAPLASSSATSSSAAAAFKPKALPPVSLARPVAASPAPLGVSLPLRTLGVSKLPSKPAAPATVASRGGRPVVPSSFDDDEDSLELDIEEVESAAPPGGPGSRAAGAGAGARNERAEGEEEVVEIEHDWDD